VVVGTVAALDTDSRNCGDIASLWGDGEITMKTAFINIGLIVLACLCVFLLMLSSYGTGYQNGYIDAVTK
jgi:hypothetical protein